MMLMNVIAGKTISHGFPQIDLKDPCEFVKSVAKRF